MEMYTLMESTKQPTEEEEGFFFEDPIQRAVVASITLLASVVGLTGNTLVIVAVILSRKLQTKTNVFVVNLAVADVLTCSVLPFQAVAQLADPWPLPSWICSAVGLLVYICLWTSNINLALIAFNRYNVVVKARADYEKMYTTWKMAMWVMFSWLLPTFLLTLPPALNFGALGYSSRYKVCTAKLSNKSDTTSHWYAALLGVTVQVPLICLIVIGVSYSLLFRHIRRHNRQMMEMLHLPASSKTLTTLDAKVGVSQSALSMQRYLFQRQCKVTKNLFVVFCSFLFCMLPFGIVSLVPPIYPAFPWVTLLMMANSCVNPIIYGLKHPNFKEVFRPLLSCSWRSIPQPAKILVSLIEGPAMEDTPGKF